MIILPAIDIKDGQCVRLTQGDYHTATKVAESPFETAKTFQADGAQWLHLVDLDGAKERKPMNLDLIRELICQNSLKVEIGGGIRDLATIESYLKIGAERVILGSAAVKNPELVKLAVKEFQDKIAVGIDAREEYVATEGWLDKSTMHYLELAKRMEDIGVKTLIYTDISRDGTLQGVNSRELSQLHGAVSCQIIASGGVRSIEDIRICRELGLYGCICGKALYSGNLELSMAIREAGEQQC